MLPLFFIWLIRSCLTVFHLRSPDLKVYMNERNLSIESNRIYPLAMITKLRAQHLSQLHRTFKSYSSAFFRTIPFNLLIHTRIFNISNNNTSFNNLQQIIVEISSLYFFPPNFLHSHIKYLCSQRLIKK